MVCFSRKAVLAGSLLQGLGLGLTFLRIELLLQIAGCGLVCAGLGGELVGRSEFVAHVSVVYVVPAPVG